MTHDLQEPNLKLEMKGTNSIKITEHYHDQPPCFQLINQPAIMVLRVSWEQSQVLGLIIEEKEDHLKMNFCLQLRFNLKVEVGHLFS
jgi:hypothetical protein